MDILPEQYMINEQYNSIPIFDGISADGSLPLIPFNSGYELDNFSTTFNDATNYHGLPFGPYIENNANDLDPESVPPDLDNKLLGFGAPVHKQTILDQNGQTWPRLCAELNGMFCVAEDVFEGETTGRPLELTCYRRNLFQISGSITISRSTLAIIQDQNRQMEIYELSASLTATESIEGKAAEIICVPWKSGLANGLVGDDKSGTAPVGISLDLSSNQEGDPLFVTIPIAWGRLQFKVATANNGRRKGLQQHYSIQIALMAKLEDGQMVKLVEIQSNPVVVRGRSPKNFDSSKDVPLNERRAESRARIANGGSGAAAHWIEPALQQGNGQHHTQKLERSQDTSPLPPQSPTRKTGSTTSPAAEKRRPPVPRWDSNDAISQDLPARMPNASSSTEDDETTPPFSLPSGKMGGKTTMSSPIETPDLLYEYFPLNLDDWLPPVDAIYRPHVVHHIKLPPEVKAQQVRAKPKRYFSADD